MCNQVSFSNRYRLSVVQQHTEQPVLDVIPTCTEVSVQDIWGLVYRIYGD
jgi:hypothetical protein